MYQIDLRGNSWKDYDRHRFLQPDLLHPTVEGISALALLVLDALVESRETVPADSIRWSVRELVRELLPTAPEDEDGADEDDEAEEEPSYGQMVMRSPFESATPDGRLGSFMPAWA